MTFKLTKCPRCKKLFAAKPGKIHCANCTGLRMDYMERIEEALSRWKLKTPEEIANFAGIPLEEVNTLLGDRSLMRDEEPQEEEDRPVCKHCRDRAAIDGSAYCRQCYTLLNELLGNAADEMVNRLNGMPAKIAPAVGTGKLNVIASLNSKRRRPGHIHESLTPKNRYS